MDAILPYLLALLFLPLSLYLVRIFRRKASDDRENLPPGSTGWPVLGENIRFALGPEKFVKDRMQKYSANVFKTSLLGEKMAIFCGAKGNKFLFTSESKLLASWLPRSIEKVLTFPEVIEKSMKGESTFRKMLHHDVFSPEALKRYVPMMDTLAHAHLDRDWKPDSVVRVLPLSKKYTFELVCRLFLSEVDPVRIKKLSDPFTVLTKGMISVPINFPGTAYNRAIKAGKIVREEVVRIIKKRRKEVMDMGEGEGRDLLSKMVVVKDGDGQFLSEKQICNDIVGTLVASFDTTSSAITSVFNYLAQLPHIYNEVLKEQMAIAETKGPDGTPCGVAPALRAEAEAEAELGHHHLKVKDTKMTIYFQDYSGGPNATVIEIPDRPAGPLNFFKFGTMICTDDPLTEGFEESSAQIGRGRGFSVTSALDGSHTHLLLSIVFTNKKYNGSTLEIQGSSPQFEQVREVAVVGGTGKFRLARGYATFETLHYDPIRFLAVIRCNLTVLHY